MINSVSANMNISDYCSAMDRQEITVNNSYQRSDKVWPDAAKSYLIESVILGYPIPKLYLYLKPDPKNRKTVKEIVDGQQRSRTIHDFLNDKFVLSQSLDSEEYRGLRYSTLPEDIQGRFLSYILTIDQFVGADSAEVRQVFRRMNSYTVPLNPEELRHAQNQGQFKWFISRIGMMYTDQLVKIGIFGDKSVVRMQDLKLYTEIAVAFDKGITTTSRKNLDKIYSDYDGDGKFMKQADFQKKFDDAFSLIGNMTFLKNSNIAKPYQIYSLAIAVANVSEKYRANNNVKEIQWNYSIIEKNLVDLSDAIDTSEDEIKNSVYRAFIEASSERTNVKDQREKRVSSFEAAITPALI